MTVHYVPGYRLATGIGVLLFSFIVTLPLAAGAVPDHAGVRFSNPVWSPDGTYLALSDQGRDGVYIYDTAGETCLRITDSPSSGYAYHWSSDSRRLGFKLLIPTTGSLFPLQMPVLYDLDRRELLALHAPAARAGVPSFSNDARVAFTIDQELHVTDLSGLPIATFPLGHYANLAPISPDGTRVAYNGRDDRIWLIELADGATRRLTSDDDAYFNPIWSPDARRLVASTVSANLRSIDVTTGQMYELDEGTTPCWAPDSSTIFYSRTDRIDGVRVNEADIYHVQWDGSGRRRLDGEPGEQETDARLSPDGNSIAFVSMATGKLYRASVVKSNVSVGSGPGSAQYARGPAVSIRGGSPYVTTLDSDSVPTFLTNESAAPMQQSLLAAVGLTRTVPYLHQVYDTPDDFNGHWACGASSALMAINYFNILPYWDITCSGPYSHVSHYGQYVSEIYSYNGHTYDIRGKDASGGWAYGGYGYIIQDDWADTKGHMRDYIINHGLTSSVDWSPTWTELQNEVNNDDPFVVLNSLTTAGHYITTIGYYDNQHTAIFNDPYGNKNTPDYPSYDGAGVMYDWPGYNNGFQNLNTVHCFIYCRGDLPPAITQQPDNQSVPWGEDAFFTIEAAGEGTLTYQWQKGTTDLANGWEYAGVTSPTLTVFDATDQQVGDYRCVVSNVHGSTPSNPATLTVIGPPVAPCDMDVDGDVDQGDFGLFQACLTGIAVPQSDPACAKALLDRDTDVDANDTLIFLGCMSGPGVPPDVYCAEP